MSVAKKLILVVDDEEHNREMYSEAFKENNEFEVVVAKDGLEAYRLARQRTFDAICTDFRMPKLDGAKLIVALRDNEPNKDIPMIVITGFKEEAVDECEKAQVADGLTFVEKPISPSKLVDTVRPMLKVLSQTPTVAKAKPIDSKMIKPFIEALTLTIKSMGQAKEVVAEKSYILRKGEKLGVDVSGAISIISTSFKGTLYVSFPKDTILAVVNNMLGEKHTQMTADMDDASAELTNIIYGNTKRVLSEQGYEFQTTLPSVVKGADHAMTSNGQYPVIVTLLTTDLGKIFIQICFNEMV